LTQLPVTPPVCEESAHYPVFNPQDPRHNPALRTNTWPEVDYIPPQTTGSTSSIRWMQSLPRRSLRRARSGLLALRSGLSRRPVYHNSSRNEDTQDPWSSSDSAGGFSSGHDELFSSTVSEASTEEDYEFGIDLFRAGCHCPSGYEDEAERSPKFPSSIPYPHPGPLPSPNTGVNDLHGGILVEMTSNAYFMGPPTSPVVNPDQFRIETEPGTTLDGHCGVEHPNPTPPDHGSHTARIEVIPEEVRLSDESSSSIVPDSSTLDGDLHASSLDHSPQSNDVPVPSDEAQISLQVEEGQPISPSGLEDNMSMIIEQATHFSLTPDESPTIPHHAPPESELEDVGYYRSLHLLGTNEIPCGNESDEEPRQSSTSDDDANPSLNPWLPIDIDKSNRTSLLSLRDEYFLVDGKSSDLRPDRGDNPLKAEQRFTGDGSLHSGPGLDRSLSTSTQDIPEIIGPRGPMGIPAARSLRSEREGSDSTDEYLVTYSLLHRHYFS
ncbi:hypothetical protein AOCH_006594, partial [Aspergillus ochraceoroseus]